MKIHSLTLSGVLTEWEQAIGHDKWINSPSTSIRNTLIHLLEMTRYANFRYDIRSLVFRFLGLWDEREAKTTYSINDARGIRLGQCGMSKVVAAVLCV